MKTLSKIFICSLLLTMAFMSCESEDYSPFLEVVNSSSTFVIEGVYIDSGANLVSGDYIGPGEFRDFSTTAGTHNLRVVTPGHDFSDYSFDQGFSYGFFFEIEVDPTLIYGTEWYHKEYWGLD